MHETFHPCEYPKQYDFEEYCVWCDNFIPVRIDDNDHEHYQVECPVCGEPLFLCTLCQQDMKDLDGCEKCNFADGTCFRRSGGV